MKEDLTKTPGLILLTGATGYVGGRLLRALEKEGRRLRCLARRPEYLKSRVGEGTEVVEGDVLDLETLVPALHGVETAYYMVHSMGSKGGFEEADRRGAENFVEAARRGGVKRLVYLGGLGSGSDLSSHLESRHEVGRILRESGIPCVEFRASIIIGSGSLSFAMIRSLVNKLPVMITPRWVRSLSQPISIEDVIAYLTAALDLPPDEGGVFEIGGPDKVSYADTMMEYARQRGLSRWIIPVPVLTTRLSSLWLGLVTPLYARVGRKLIESVRNDTVVTDDRALRVFPVRPRPVAEAIQRALLNEDEKFAQTRWSDALSVQGEPEGWGGIQFGARLLDSRTVDVPCTPAEAFKPIERIGGKTGWYAGAWLWRLRGFLDRLVGGPGLRRGRRDPHHLEPGDTLDFWRVEDVQPNKLLRLAAEMKLPGRAWLQFEVEETRSGSRIRQTAIFDPLGIFGVLYWYAVYPLHGFVFGGMIKGIAAAARRRVGAGSVAQPAGNF